jgi:hypothetical protein
VVYVHGSGYKVTSVVKVDDTVCLEPNSDIEYKWIVAKLDTAPYQQLIDRNKAVTDTVRDAYTVNLRQQMANTIMANLSLDAKANLQSLLAPPAVVVPTVKRVVRKRAAKMAAK